jgi:hypothetical protein
VSLGISSLYIKPSSADLGIPTDMPYIIVYPENVVAEPGQNITITVAIYNLTNRIHATNTEWNLGEPLTPYNAEGIYTYPLGFLVGFDLKLTWDPNVLEYLDHNVTIPVEDYPDPILPLNFTGTLHKNIQPIADDVDAVSGTYHLARAHIAIGTVNYFNGNGTLFQMMFNVKIEGGSPLTIKDSKLAAPRSDTIGQTYNKVLIPHGMRSGFFLTSGAKTRVYSLDVKASVYTQSFDAPVIVGENGTVETTMRNEGSITDYYNLTLYHKYPNATTIVIQELLNQEINTTEREQDFEVVVESSYLVQGNHTFTANASILHGVDIFLASLSKQVRVISADFQLQVASLPENVYIKVPVTLDATGSSHSEPTGYFTQYKWEFRESPTAPPRDTLTNSTPTVSYAFPLVKNWTVSLIVTDNFGITYNSLRPATAAYKLSFIVETKEKVEVTFPWDLVALAVILVVVIAVAGYFYMRRRR